MELGNVTRREVSLPLAAWVDHAVTPDEGTGAENAVAADLGMVADEGAKFAKAGGDGTFGCVDGHGRLVEAHIRENDARAEVSLVAEDRVADIIEMRNLGLVEDEAVFKFRGISSHDTIAEDDIFADVTPIPNLTVLADPSRTFDHGSLFDHCPFADKNRTAHERLADEAAMETGFHAELEISRDLRQNIPDMLGVLEKGLMLAVAEIKKFVDGKHGVIGLVVGFRRQSAVPV